MPYLVRQSESGNGLVIILIAIALLVSLTAMMTRSSGTSDDTGDQERLTIQATKILRYAKSVENAVQNLLMRGCSENQISFENSVVSGYENPNAPPDKSCHVFDVAGGGVIFNPMSSFFGPADYFRFNGNNRVKGFGCDDFGGSAECSELLLLVVMNGNPDFCLMLNEFMGINNPSGEAPQVSEIHEGAYFKGNFVSISGSLIGASNAGPELKGKSSGCLFEFGGGQNKYFFYHVLLAR